MPTLKVGALMRYYLDDQVEAEVHGDTVAQVLQDAVSRYPALGPHVFDATGGLRRHIQIFINDENMRERQGLKTRLAAGDRLRLLVSISGGGPSAACLTLTNPVKNVEYV